MPKNKEHINRFTSSTYNILRKVHQSRSLPDENTTKNIVQALVLLKLDYCNSLLLGLPEYQNGQAAVHPEYGMQGNFPTMKT